MPAAPMFPSLSRPTVFIASPGDVAYLRVAVAQEFDELRLQVANDRDVDIFRWEIDTAPTGFDDSVPAQEQIYLTSDPLCRALVCILGETLGTPLGDIPLDPLGDMRSVNGFGPVHPWRGGAEADGGFPVTGTVFEYLTALRRKERDRILLLVAADDSVLTATDPLRANWGHRRLLATGQRTLSLPDQCHWLPNIYTPRLVQLSNFITYLKGRGYSVDVGNLVADASEARLKVRSFLERALNYRRRSPQHSPFKGLEPYAESDVDVFFGRVEWRRTAVATFRQLWTQPGKLPYFGIVGGSGTGKSSLLRAGMIAHLIDPTTEGSFCSVVLRPDDCFAAEVIDASAEPFAEGTPLAGVMRRLLDTIGRPTASDAVPILDSADIVARLAKFRADAQLAEAVAELVRALDRHGSDHRLIIGLDQFETMVDASIDPHLQRSVRAAFEFQRACAESGRIGVIYTLQSNRFPLLDADPVLGPLGQRGHTQPVGLPDESGLQEIVSRPFEAVGLSLEPRLRDALRDAIIDFANRAGSDRGSILPLVSVQLARLHDAATRGRRRRRAAGLRSSTGESSADKLVDPADARMELALDDYREFVKLGSAIAHFADASLAEAMDDAYLGIDERTVGELLELLVRPIAADGERLDLPAAAMPADRAQAKLARAMLDRRLLLWEGDKRIRLVHESVIRHWPRARVWLEAELQLLGYIQIATVRARHWNGSGRSPEALKGDIDEVAEILAKRVWLTIPTLIEEDRLLRDYGLALLRSTPTPTKGVRNYTGFVPHVYLAARYGDVGLCAHYLAVESSCATARSSTGRLPLMGALINGSLECLDFWLAHNEPNAADADGSTSVHYAAWGPVDALKRCAAAGAALDRRDSSGRTALHLAAQAGRIDNVDFLMDATGEGLVFVRDSSGNLPIHVAAVNGRTSIVRRLLQVTEPHVMEVNDDGWMPFHLAARYGHAEVLKLFAGRPAFDPNDLLQLREKGGHRRPVPALHLCIDSRNQATLETLLAHPATDLSLRSRGETVLHYAARTGGASLVAALLAMPDLDPNLLTDAGLTALHLAVEHKREDVVRRLLQDARVRPQTRSTTGTTPLGTCPHTERSVLTILLEDSRIDPLLREPSGRTPLLIAAEAELTSIALQLLARGFDESVPGYGAEVLYFAAGAGDIQLVTRLIHEHGVDPWFPVERESKATPLHRAIGKGHRDVVEILLAAPTQLPEQIAASDAISAAVMRFDTLDILERLLADGRFNPNAVDENERSAIQHAAIRGNVEGVRLLLADPRVRGPHTDSWSRSLADLAPVAARAVILASLTANVP
jgi:ankyrin repeat protein